MKIPFYGWRTWLRIVVKALVLLAIFDIVFISLDLSDKLLTVSVFGSLVPYRNRLVAFQEDVPNQLLPLDVLLRAHEIARPKAADEFRVVLLGDSGILGAGDPDDGTVSALMTATGQTIEGKHVRAYNLAFPVPSAIRDLLIGDASLTYQPDLIVWFVTLAGFRDDGLDQLIEANPRLMTQLTAKFGLNGMNARTYGHASEAWWQRSIFVQNSVLYRWLKLQTFFAVRQYSFKTIPAGIILQFPVPKEPAIRADDPAFAPMPNPNWPVLPALTQLARVPVLVVNEPILVMPQAGVNYNLEIGRQVYDDYRTALNQYCEEHYLWCLDIWDSVPVSGYTDSTVHRTVAANGIITKLVLDEAQKKLGK